LAQRMQDLPKTKPIITVCRSGRRSAQADVLLRKNGFKNTASLKDGLLAWHPYYSA